jgi:hypothetical protein
MFVLALQVDLRFPGSPASPVYGVLFYGPGELTNVRSCAAG